MLAVGIDFGTTNSAIARAESERVVQLVTFPSAAGTTDAYRSLLYLEQIREGLVNRLHSWSGPEAIECYLSAESKGRLIQSLKSFLSNRSFTTTEVFGRRRTLQELIARILADLRTKAERQFQTQIDSAVVGRPVRFVGAGEEIDNDFAQTRLREAFGMAGFETIHFEMEPVAAAYHYESTLDHDELILIADFGGGTSDFSLVRVGPGVRSRGRRPGDLLGNSGLGFAGDAFDAKIIRHLVSPALGAGTQLRSMNKTLPVPTWPYAKLERWHHLSFLKTREVLNTLNSIHAQAQYPDRIAALIHLVEEDVGYQLHRAVQQVKRDLSAAEAARFQFEGGGVRLECLVQKAQFEQWISDELVQIEQCVSALLGSSGAGPKDVDMVFLTGGSSFVPAVRRIFERLFGPRRIQAGNEFTSVARGLALKAFSLSH